MESSSLRLKIKVNENGKWKYYYDVGLRAENPQLSKYIYDKGVKRPRFLEDFIERYGVENVIIVSWGKYWRRRYEIMKMLGDLNGRIFKHKDDKSS